MIRDFDGIALFDALDRQRQTLELSWAGVARSIWDQSSALNARRDDRPMASSTILNLGRRGDTTCQHGVLFVRWLDMAPEEFLDGWTGDCASYALPNVDPARRLRWNLKALGTSLNEARHDAGITWADLAGEPRCAPNQIQNITRAKFAIAMSLAMRTVQWLDRPAADFIELARW
jgi:hypothetical protein